MCYNVATDIRRFNGLYPTLNQVRDFFDNINI